MMGMIDEIMSGHHPIDHLIFFLQIPLTHGVMTGFSIQVIWICLQKKCHKKQHLSLGFIDV